MNQTDLVNIFVPALLSPGARQKTSAIDSTTTTLDYLALSAQALRFLPPTCSSSFQQEAIFEDKQKIIQGNLRKQFRDFINELKGENADYLAEQIAVKLQSVELTPHPFDFGSIEHFLGKYLEWMGTEAQLWVAFTKSEEEATPVHDWLSLDEDTWQQGSYSQRERFLRLLRRTDPNRARELLMNDWANCNAELRLRLVTVLWDGLAESDKAFLEGLSKDRSARVKDLATSMLVRLNKGEGAQALQTLRERLIETSEGIFKKRRCFALEYPLTLPESQRPSWVLEQFWQLGLSAIAASLALSTRELIDGAVKDEGLLLCFMVAAINDKDFPVIAYLVKLWPAAWSHLAGSGLDNYPGYTDGERIQVLEILADLRNWPSGMGTELARYVLKIWGNRPLPPLNFDALLKSPWACSITNRKEKIPSGDIELLALLCPRDSRSVIKNCIDPNDENQSQACAYLDIMTSLEDYHHE